MLEEPDVQLQVQTQSTSSGGQRESGGQDPTVIEDELHQETNIQQPQQVDTRPRPKWFRSTVQDSRQVDPPQRSFRRILPP